MKSIIFLSILTFALNNRKLYIELETSVKPILVIVKFLISSDKRRKDVVII